MVRAWWGLLKVYLPEFLVLQSQSVSICRVAGLVTVVVLARNLKKMKSQSWAECATVSLKAVQLQS